MADAGRLQEEDAACKAKRHAAEGRSRPDGYQPLFTAEQADLAAGRADLIAFGKPILANPDLVERWKAGAALNAPDMATFYTPGAKGYTDYPVLVAQPA
jgi:2,4-dienoyl-CoA reductase-like NADH-dependent reductase (Old Yellow Enzyme family)